MKSVVINVVRKGKMMKDTRKLGNNKWEESYSKKINKRMWREMRKQSKLLKKEII